MTYLLGFITAVVISMTVIPLMARLAPHIGMIDRPDPRKVHAVPIPRAGGVGIVLGALVPIALWLPITDLQAAYLFGSLVLLFFGIWDDTCELGHYVKFIGQFLAVIAVVYYGDLYVTHLPFFDAVIAESIGKPFTVVAIVGVINALNHSDGLDGLAGGMSLLSLSSIVYLAYMADESTARHATILIALATIGGVFGFLRYNTHPARVFMGDGGSQFLGFTLGFLAVYLIEQVNPALSPALPALYLGLPVIDILVVFVQRVYHGMNWFRASKNHIHHRLLALGFEHYEAVVIKYSIQTLFVVCAMFLGYESDILILAIYLGVSAILFSFLITAEHRGWRVGIVRHATVITRFINAVKKNRMFQSVPVKFVSASVPVLFVVTGLLADKVPHDFGIVSAVMVVTLVLYMITKVAMDSIIAQAIYYVTAAFVIYLETRHLGQQIPMFDVTEIVFFVTLAVAIGLAIRYGEKSDFRTTPMDYLVIFVVLFASYVLHSMPDKAEIGLMVVKLILVFYACELIVLRMRSKLNSLNVSALVTLSVLAYRGLM